MFPCALRVVVVVVVVVVVAGGFHNSRPPLAIRVSPLDLDPTGNAAPRHEWQCGVEKPTTLVKVTQEIIETLVVDAGSGKKKPTTSP